MNGRVETCRGGGLLGQYVSRATAAIGLLVFGLALVSGAGTATAQEPACSFWKVTTRLLNISKEPGGENYIDVLELGAVGCVTRHQMVDGRDRGYVAYKVESPAKHTAVEGWATLTYMKELSPDEVAALGNPVATPPGAIAAASPPATAAPPPATTAPASAAGEGILRYDQPIPFGPFPVNGRSIKEIAEYIPPAEKPADGFVDVPLFPPIEGLDDALWQKHCPACHKWNQVRLCEQGKTYVKTPRFVLRQPHPFGGAFKIALMRWAIGGCQ
jgi:hypothetical protein